MDWNQPLVVNGGMLYSGQMGDHYLGEFSSHEAALEAMEIMREQREVFSASETRFCTESDLDLVETIGADEV